MSFHSDPENFFSMHNLFIYVIHFQALDVIRQSKVVQILSDGGSYSPSTSSPRSSSPVSLNSGNRGIDRDEIGLRDEDTRASIKREKAFHRLRKTLSSRGQRLMEKMSGGTADQQLSRATSRDNLSQQAKIPGAERISRSTSHLADIRQSGPSSFHP